eukprot:scaffold4414_cov135-Isochrysis_galbana.AAC.8
MQRSSGGGWVQRRRQRWCGVRKGGGEVRVEDEEGGVGASAVAREGMPAPPPIARCTMHDVAVVEA